MLKYITSFLFGFIIYDFNVFAQKTVENQPLSSFEKNTYKILSWNIQMLPRILLPVKKSPALRAKLIAEKIKADDIDIVVFQEAFDKKSRRILKRNLKHDYPYHAGPYSKNPLPFFTNSGNKIYSKYPIKKIWKKPYKWKEKQGHDKFARKGCLMVELELPDKKHIQVLGTHLQAGGSIEVRHSQYKQIRNFIDRYQKNYVPQIICGDFNTQKSDDLNYKIMLNTMDVEDGALSGELCCTSDGLLNDMKKYDPYNRKLIDFIFYKGNGVQPKSMDREIKQIEQRWSSKHKDLSDHYAILSTITF